VSGNSLIIEQERQEKEDWISPATGPVQLQISLPKNFTARLRTKSKRMPPRVTSLWVASNCNMAIILRTALFWVITQRVAVISYRRFGITCQVHPQGSWIIPFFIL